MVRSLWLVASLSLAGCAAISHPAGTPSGREGPLEITALSRDPAATAASLQECARVELDGLGYDLDDTDEETGLMLWSKGKGGFFQPNRYFREIVIGAVGDGSALWLTVRTHEMMGFGPPTVEAEAEANAVLDSCVGPRGDAVRLQR